MQEGNLIKLEMKTQLRLTPQLMQSLHMLQMTTQELNAYLDRLSQENPVMEREEDAAGWDELCRRIRWLTEKGTPVQRERPFPAEETDDPVAAAADRRTAPQDGLPAFLKEQMEGLKLPAALKTVAQYMTEMLDPSGYLEEEDLTHLKEIGVPDKLVKEALGVVQSLEPAGIGARSVAECLSLQLLRRSGDHALALRIVRDFLPEVEKQKTARIARLTGEKEEDVRRAVEEIRSLSPRPGSGFGDSGETVYLYPDVLAVEEEGELRILLVSDYSAQLRLSADYLRMLKEDPEEDVKQYLQERFRQARWVMNCMDHRKSTLEKIALRLTEVHADFLKDPAAERPPYTLGQMAQELGMNISTVSRAVAGKYLQCRHGLYPLRDFFSRTVSDNQLTEQQIKKRIVALIKDEPPEKPLSDRRIAELLENEQILIARRTVAKYREALGLPSAQNRKK